MAYGGSTYEAPDPPSRGYGGITEGIYDLGFGWGSEQVVP